MKISKNMSKFILQIMYSYSVQKSALKNTKHSARNETMLKIGRLAKAIAYAKTIAFAKWSI